MLTPHIIVPVDKENGFEVGVEIFIKRAYLYIILGLAISNISTYLSFLIYYNPQAFLFFCITIICMSICKYHIDNTKPIYNFQDMGVRYVENTKLLLCLMFLFFAFAGIFNGYIIQLLMTYEPQLIWIITMLDIIFILSLLTAYCKRLNKDYLVKFGLLIHFNFCSIIVLILYILLKGLYPLHIDLFQFLFFIISWIFVLLVCFSVNLECIAMYNESNPHHINVSVNYWFFPYHIVSSVRKDTQNCKANSVSSV